MKAEVVTGRGAHVGSGAGSREWAHPWQYALALCAVVAPVPQVLSFGPFVDGPGYLMICAVTDALVALPLFLGRRRASFVRVAVAAGAVLVPWSVIGALGGMGAFFLSVPLLWLAALADPRRRPRTAVALAGAGVLLVTAMLTVLGFWWRAL
ncbi:hypothetical protein ACGFZK_01405 [Streptomyces sp. NPDC048257]|uniref:hypothetical protein n=1 Tax=Streptomyces sp. NPDC048257 TaxID=3365526 RepID=UPI00371A405A